MITPPVSPPTVTSPIVTRPFPWVGLLVLASAIFTSVTAEFLPTGLLPDMARELEVSESQIGLLITVFAGTVVISTYPLTLLTRNVSRKSLVVIVMLVVSLGSVLTAIAPTFEVLVGARIVGGLAHGLFWAVVGAYSAHLVPKHQIGRAVAITSGGGTAAFVLGVPVGTALGHAVGWRLAFVGVAAIIVILVILVIRYLPAVDHRVSLATGEIALPVRRDRSMPGVIILGFVILILMTAQNIFYTYVAPWLITVADFDESAIAGLLFLYGGAGAVGLVIAGFVSDRFPRGGLIVGAFITAASVLVLGVASSSQVVVVVSIVIWGIAFGGLPAIFGARMLRTASARVRDTASALQTTSFNLAIGTGALVGGLLLDRFGLVTLPFVAAVVYAVGIVLVLVTDAWLAARSRRARSQRL